VRRKEELIQIGDLDEEVKKQEEQEKLIEEEIRELDLKQGSKDEDELTPHLALQNLKKLLRFIQLLCENHNPNLQNQLREQTNAEGNLLTKSFDFVSHIAKMLGYYQKMFNIYTCDMGY